MHRVDKGNMALASFRRSFPIHWGFKPPADVADFLRVIYRASSVKIQTQIRQRI